MLDTHVALWALTAPEKLRQSIRVLIEDPRTTVSVSAASVWEVAIKRASGKLESQPNFASICIDRGFEPLAITFDHAELAGRLPQHHADPFDRMLIAQATAEDLELVSQDRVFERYDVRLLIAK